MKGDTIPSELCYLYEAGLAHISHSQVSVFIACAVLGTRSKLGEQRFESMQQAHAHPGARALAAAPRPRLQELQNELRDPLHDLGTRFPY